ncbi:hypothetical protein NL108_004732%2C partial [Scomber scombrus]|uniref:Uncharacterized protein n=1 Tax=Scomber scombrus TaxID=13677 RepID=A0AAV1PVL3_SCOSC
MKVKKRDDATLSNLSAQLDYSGFQYADMVIEALSHQGGGGGNPSSPTPGICP